MQVTSNTTQMMVDCALGADREAREHCVVVIKGTFLANAEGELRLADEQEPLVASDQYYGDPATTSARYECDFAREKPLTDVIVVGKAVAPQGQRVRQLPVRLELPGRSKDLMVHGERRWVVALGTLVASDPVPFSEMPIVFERAWGGQDDSRGPNDVAVEPRNLVGVGFHPYRSNAQVDGLPVPNIEPLARPIDSPRAGHEPAGLGCIGRGWQPRVGLAGTYDDRWRDERAPYLPSDFDSRYFQCAPADQQLPRLSGGETIRCVHMAEQPIVTYVVPRLRPPVRFRFADNDIEHPAVLDTITLEPHKARAMLVWRASVPLPKKLTLLREILVGDQRARAESRIVGYHHGKPKFADLADAIAWLRERRGGDR